MERNKEHYYTSLYELAAALNTSHAPQAILKSVAEGVAKATIGAGL